MVRICRLLTLLMTLLCAAPLPARDYYVAPGGDDAHPGTLARPLKDPVAAARRLGPGDRLVFRAGVYTCRTNDVVGLAPARDGAPGRPIVFTNYAGEHVRLISPSSWGVTNNGFNHIVFDGLDIRGQGQYGMKIAAHHGSAKRGSGSHVTIRNCEVHHAPNENIFCYETPYLRIENNHLHHSGRSHGLYLQTGCHHAVIRNNTSEDNTGNSGMQLNAAGGGIEDAVVERNLIRRNAQGLSLMGVQASRFVGNVLFNNAVDGPRGSGYREIICWTYDDARTGRPGTPCRGLLFENNTIVNLRPKKISHLLEVKGRSRGLVFRSNILVIAADRPLMTVAPDSLVGMRWAGNLCQTPSDDAVVCGAEGFELEAWAARLQSPDTNAAGDPGFGDGVEGENRFVPGLGSSSLTAGVGGRVAGAVDPVPRPAVRIGCNPRPWANPMAFSP